MGDGAARNGASVRLLVRVLVLCEGSCGGLVSSRHFPAAPSVVASFEGLSRLYVWCEELCVVVVIVVATVFCSDGRVTV